MHGFEMPSEISAEMSRLWNSIQRDENERIEAAAKADPRAHKLTRVTENTRYLYYSAGKNGKGQAVRFCYATHRNVAGYFLGWREVIRKDGTGKRDMWTARKGRKAVAELARKRANRILGATNA